MEAGARLLQMQLIQLAEADYLIHTFNYNSYFLFQIQFLSYCMPDGVINEALTDQNVINEIIYVIINN